MKITAIETLTLAEFPNVLWVRVHTGEGIVGLGETFYMAQPVAVRVHARHRLVRWIFESEKSLRFV